MQLFFGVYTAKGLFPDDVMLNQVLNSKNVITLNGFLQSDFKEKIVELLMTSNIDRTT